MPGRCGGGHNVRPHEVVADWESLDEQARFDMFSRALLQLCNDDAMEARSLWGELESLRSRSGGLRQPWPRHFQHA